MPQDHHTDFGLSARDRQTISDILVKYPDVIEVNIFGSRSKGNYKQGSDIDMAVMNEGVSDKTILRMKADFEDSSLPYKVDVINYPALHASDLKDHIRRVGVSFYSRGQS
jgi:predicted nucleotidyltransferase